MSIVCTNFKAYEKNSLLGFADFYMEKWGVEIKGCTYHDKNGARWVSMPSKAAEQNAETKYYAILRFKEKNHQDAWSDMAKKAIELYVKENSNKQTSKSYEDQGCPF